MLIFNLNQHGLFWCDHEDKTDRSIEIKLHGYCTIRDNHSFPLTPYEGMVMPELIYPEKKIVLKCFKCQKDLSNFPLFCVFTSPFELHVTVVSKIVCV